MNFKVKVIIAVAAGLVLLGGLAAYVYSRDDGDSVETEQSTAYIEWSEAAFAEHADKQRWLYFHADWCPQCIALNIDIRNHLADIPPEVVILKVDFTKNDTLKQRYGVTKQTTIVSVDEKGDELKRLLVDTSLLSQAVEALYIQPQAEDGEESDNVDGSDDNPDASGADDNSSSDDNPDASGTDGSGDANGNASNDSSNASGADSSEAAAGPYIEWSEAAFAEHVDKQRWLYFHADWCSQCIALNADIKSHVADIPTDVAIFKVDFVKNDALKQRHGITLQTTIVSVDEQGDKLNTFRAAGSETLAQVISGLGYGE